MTTEMYNHCILCNAEVNWLEVEFRSEQNEPIKGLKVTITNPSTMQTHQKSASQGHVVFDNIAAGEWVVSVQTDNLLSTVEQYESRKEGEESPVKGWSDEQLDRDQSPKAYYEIMAGDLWDTLPEDDFLKENHGPLRTNYREDARGFRTCHNRACVLGIKALRSYIPMIVDTDEFSLVNSYTFALLSKLAYATDTKSVDKQSETDGAGSIETIIKQFKNRQIPSHSSDLETKWLVAEIPYSQALEYSYYSDDVVGAEGYILFNDDIAIIGVRGTEPYFEDRNRKAETQLLKVVKAASGIQAVVMDKLNNIVQSPGMQDLVITDLDAAQIAPPEFGGAYVHRGFYQYTMALWNTLKDDFKELHRHKKIYCCGHSLGGAGALLLSALVQDAYSPPILRLYTYGMPRTGTRSFVQRYRDILHCRHVNNHDLVPQIPMIWVNTDVTEGFESSDIFSSGVTLAKRMVTDDDDDNYRHHGRLSQLIDYAESKQVLLSPRQTQITMLDIAKMAGNDSVALVDGLRDASVSDHDMEFYVPNLWNQLRMLNKESLYENYQGAITYLSSQVSDLQKSYSTVQQERIKVMGMTYSPVVGAKKRSLQKEKSVLEDQLQNHQQVLAELTSIMNNPERMPLSLLLLANQSFSEDIKEQLK